MVKVTFLGTGTSQGVPPIGCDSPVCLSNNPKDKRLRASVHIQIGNKSIVIDTGPDFRQQMMREQIYNLDAVLFTHEHRDHTAGIDEIRPFNFMQQKPMEMYCSAHFLEQIKLQFNYIFKAVDYPGIPQINWHIIEIKPFFIDDIEVIPIQVMHYKLPVFGFRIGKFTYITDANYISPEEINKIKGTEVLVLNALQYEPHISHYTVDEAVGIAQQIGAPQTYFTHMSHKIGFHDEVNNMLPSGIELAYDGLVLKI